MHCLVFGAGNWRVYGRVKRARMEKNGAVNCMLDRMGNEGSSGGKADCLGEKEWRGRRKSEKTKMQ